MRLPPPPSPLPLPCSPRQYLGPFVRRALRPLADAGYLELVYGGGAVGQRLCNHPGVASGACAEVWRGRRSEGQHNAACD